MTEEKISIQPITSSFGAEVIGFDLCDTNDAAVSKLKLLLLQHRVLVLRGQALTDKQLVTISAKLGQLDVPAPNPYGAPFHNTHPEINVISNIVVDDKPAGNLGSGEAVWHADMTYRETPPCAAILHALEVPHEGGDTYFADMYAAYATLPEDVKSQLDGKVAIHDEAHNSAGVLRKGYSEGLDVRETPGARHPLVRTEGTAGRKALFLGRRPRSYIPGLTINESDDLLDQLWAHAARPEFVISHQWRAHGVLMWSNLEVLHCRDSFDASMRRRMHRTQIGTFWPETKLAPTVEQDKQLTGAASSHG